MLPLLSFMSDLNRVGLWFNCLISAFDLGDFRHATTQVDLEDSGEETADEVAAPEKYAIDRDNRFKWKEKKVEEE